MASKIEVTAYHYNTLCDNYGCGNMARVAIGIKGFPVGTNHNICNECFDGILEAGGVRTNGEATITAVLEREDVKAFIETLQAEIPLAEVLKRPDVREYINHIAQTIRKEALEGMYELQEASPVTLTGLDVDGKVNINASTGGAIITGGTITGEIHHFKADEIIVQNANITELDVTKAGEIIPFFEEPEEPETLTDEEELIATYDFKQLQAMAKELGINSFGMSTENLRKAVTEALREG